MKLGLVCISELLRDKSPELKFKTITRAQFNKKDRKESIRILSERIAHNIRVTIETIKHCKEVGIKRYRLSCKLFPLLTDPTLKIQVEELPNHENIVSLLSQVGRTANLLEVNLSIHPDQFVVLGSNKDSVCEKSITELNFHAWVLDMCGMPQDYTCPINIHPSLSNFESPEKFINKLMNNFFRCDTGVKKRLVFENEDKGFWNCANLYEYFHQYMKHNFNFAFPLTFDNLHDEANPSLDEKGEKINISKWFLKFYSTWNVEPVFHWSQAAEGTVRNHCKNLTKDPIDFGLDVTWEIEVKGKDKGFKHLLKKYRNI